MSILRTPEDFWRKTGPKSPWGPFDYEAALNFSMDISPWVASAGAGLTLVGCTIEASTSLQITNSIVGSEVYLNIKATPGETLVPGEFLKFKLKWVLSDNQRDGRTFYLLVRDR